jgi:regulatory protein YycH of two-component signal transduction system YycFG
LRSAGIHAILKKSKTKPMTTITFTDEELDAVIAAFNLAFDDNDEEFTGYSNELIESISDKLFS